MIPGLLVADAAFGATVVPKRHEGLLGDCGHARPFQLARRLEAPKSDPHDQAKAHFAKQVAARLNEAVRAGKVDEIILAAPAHVLHDIREALDKAASGKLGKTLSKDFANTPDGELASHFQ